MAKRLIVVSMILVVLLSVFSVFASAAEEYTLNTLYFLDNGNMMEFVSAPNAPVSQNHSAVGVVNQYGVAYFNDNTNGTSQTWSTSQFAFVQIPTEDIYGTGYIQVQFDFPSGNPYENGIDYFVCNVYKNAEIISSYDFMDGEDVLWFEYSPGDRFSFEFFWDDYSNYFVPYGLEVGMFAARVPSYGSYPSNSFSLPMLWLISYEGGTDNDQYEQGYEDGYSDGYNDALAITDLAKNQIFNTASYTAVVDLDDGIQINVAITPNVTADGVYFKTARDQISAALPEGIDFADNVDSVTIVLTWESGEEFDYVFTPIYVSGDSLISYGTLTTVGGKSYTLRADRTSYTTDEFKIQEVVTGSVIVKQFTVYVGRPEDLLTSFSLVSNSRAFNEGYSVGYDSGYEAGEDDGYLSGRNVGYRDGFVDGKAEGSANAENGTWRELVGAVIDAPINAFRSLFNFEILGLDMRLAIGSLLTIVVLLIIIKKLVL